MLTSIRRDGTGLEWLKPHESAAVVSWWQGKADLDQQKAAQQILVALHERRRWLLCGCRGDAAVVSSRPYLAPAKTDSTLYLRRMQNRHPHATTCTFWHDQVHSPTSAQLSNNALLAVHGIAPSFLLDDFSKLVLSKPSNVPPAPNDSSSSYARLPRHAARLFWLAQASGFQQAPNFANPVHELLKTAQKVPVGPALNLQDLLYCNVRAWSEAWYRKPFRLCIDAGIEPSCWLIQLAVEFDVDKRIITYKDDAQKLLTVPVYGEMKVFGGVASAARFPMVVIALIKKTANGAILDSAYAHPVLDDTRWMLVDSDLERKTYADLADICFWLKQEKGLGIEIEKPLYAWQHSNERPDFVLTLTSRAQKRQQLVVETMGFEDPQYEARKLALAANVKCPVFFDRRAEKGNVSNFDLAAAVAYWAGQFSL